ncbi:hypothetical protein ACMDCR_27615 [Labrys okinawensis]|uniref:hypothetical protein n=1 Tax=Labrys okinawensis TaxID=346911 RepID=UPI0039BCB1A4
MILIANILFDAGCAALCAYVAVRWGYLFWVLFWPSFAIFFFISPLLVVLGLAVAVLIRFDRPVLEERYLRRSGEIRCGACDRRRKQDRVACPHCGAPAGYRPPIANGEAPVFLKFMRAVGEPG